MSATDPVPGPDARRLAGGRPVVRNPWRGQRTRRYIVAILLVVTLAVSAAGWWWQRAQEDVEPVSVRPVTVCHGLYETAELDRILGSSIGDYHVVPRGPWDANCHIESGLSQVADATGKKPNETIMSVYFRSGNEYESGLGYEWTDEGMAADTENYVVPLNIPELEGNTYLWVLDQTAEKYVYGIWFGDGFVVAVALRDVEGSVDGPMSVQAAIDVMPELLAYVGTNTLKHPALPTGEPSGTSVAPVPSVTPEAPAPTETADDVEDTGVDPVIVITPTAS